MTPGDVAPLMAFLALVSGVTLTLIFRGPIGKALARRLEGSAVRDEDGAARLEQVEERLAVIEQHQERLLELEERLDFAERLLARGDAERRTP